MKGGIVPKAVSEPVVPVTPVPPAPVAPVPDAPVAPVPPRLVSPGSVAPVLASGPFKVALEVFGDHAKESFGFSVTT